MKKELQPKLDIGLITVPSIAVVDLLIKWASGAIFL